MRTLWYIWFAVICGIAVYGCSGKRPSNLGVSIDKLMPCPDTPNCVVSQYDDEKHYIQPIAYVGDKKEAINKIKKIINSQKRARIIEETDNYIRVEFTSALMKFVDDVEFYFPDENIIHVRSASRIGYSDLGVNRRRIENIRKLFNENQ